MSDVNRKYSKRFPRMDELDNTIINLLQLDGRVSNAKIAREAGVSEGTVRRRLKKLIDSGFLNVVAILNIDKSIESESNPSNYNSQNASKFCTACGMNLAHDAKFCEKCGKQQ